MNRILTIALVALILLSAALAACAPAKPAEPAAATQTSANDEAWQRNLRAWLAVGYQQGAETASFASIDSAYLKTASLYATYGSLGSLAELGAAADNAAAVVAWIESLATESGAYDDPSIDIPRLVETLWAVEALQSLHAQPGNAPAVVAYVAGLQSGDGLFRLDEEMAPAGIEEQLIATYYAAELLTRVGQDSDAAQERLQRAAGPLQAYLQEALAAPEIDAGDADYVAAAAHALAQIDSALLPPSAAAQLGRLAEPASAAAALHPSAPLRYNMLLDALAEIGGAGELDSLRRAVQEQILPYFVPVNDANVAAQLDPVLAYQAMRLARRLEVATPAAALQRNLARYQIANGWMTFIIPAPNAEATYRALSIAQHVGYEDYDAGRVAAYLDSFLQVDDPAFDLESARYALLGLALLGGTPDAARLPALRTAALAQLEAGRGSSDVDSQLVTFALLAQSLGWDIPPFVGEESALAMADIDEGESAQRIDRLYDLAVLAQIADQTAVSEESLARRVWALWSDEGGFKAAPQAPLPDLDSTQRGVEILALLKQDEALDRAKIRAFVLACRADYGFDYVPAALAARASESYSADPDLFVTDKALSLLRFLDAAPSGGK